MVGPREAVEPIVRPPVAVTPRAGRDPGWSHGAAVFGFISTALVLSLAIGSEVMRDRAAVVQSAWTAEWTATVALGSASMVVGAVSGPVVFAGGASARRSGVEGSSGARIGGWLSYGLGVSLASALIVLAPAGTRPPVAMIALSGVATSLGLVLFSADALVARGQALDGGGERRATRGAGWQVALRVSPLVSGERTGGMVGLGGIF